MEIDRCVVCKKYLETLGEQERAMCLKCDKATEIIANGITKSELINN